MTSVGNTAKCPNCGSPYLIPADSGWKCRSCGYEGIIRSFTPVRDDDAPAEAARLEDAVCANHPGKKAIAVCSGTGDYVCSLCRVTIHGRDYSVQYLDRGGKLLADQTFSQYMPRPDRLVQIMLLVSFFFLIGTPILFIFSCVFLFRAYRLRREDAVYAKVMAPVWMWLCWVAHLLIALLVGGFLAFAIIGVITDIR